MLESILAFLAIAFVIALVVGVAGYFALRWMFMGTAERMAAIVDRSVGGAAATAFTRLARFAQARGIPLEEAHRLFGAHIDRLARIMDSAITLPIIGRVGLDAVLDLIPVFGNFAGAAISLTLIARTLQYGPPPSLVSKMLSNVLVDVILGAIPLVGPLADLWWKANDRNAALMREFLSISDLRR
ncbi:MAG TPA: DUF4112 domain-containing protein [Vicinamibacterales bacterium]|nr:DUF4112 domain-containing protein [Vicinamibacterales bacterium]